MGVDALIHYFLCTPETKGTLVTYPDSKVHGANMGPIWGRQDPGGPHVGPMNLVILVTDSIQRNLF